MLLLLQQSFVRMCPKKAVLKIFVTFTKKHLYQGVCMIRFQVFPYEFVKFCTADIFKKKHPGVCHLTFQQANVNNRIKSSRLMCHFVLDVTKRPKRCYVQSVSNVQIWSFSCSVFSRIATENWDLHGESSYSIQRRENTDQKKIQIRTFSRELKCVKYEQINFIFSMINFALLKLYSKLNFFHSTDKS